MREIPKIALVDDNENILTSVSIALTNEGFDVATYIDGTAALEDFKAVLPDLVILDIKMPIMDGMEVLYNLRKISDIPVIFLTSKDDEVDEILALKMGADDFIKKPFSHKLLVERIKVVLRRYEANKKSVNDGDNSSEMDSVIVRGDLILDKKRHLCSWKGKEINLTVTEFYILQALVERPGIVKTRESLLEVAYNDQIFVDDRSIDSHIRRLRKKFKNIDEGFNMIETLYGVGYRYEGF